ncbi:hypothetical protein GCM10010123_02580 [Pilimelia anulata]|uniref:DUF11 domain-containing protein n=1 Tax=Pilimelia anulata TaxID=53371 RepID=A0A8J3B6V6_9ACTN|nr:DUF11 domain-containing protein [Pilimelia anulata]GGJ76096.1 hypothetical protein GCM10010123_02580 [Pilimelia anulata]
MRMHPVGHALVALGLVGAVAAPVSAAPAPAGAAASIYLYDVTVAQGGSAKYEELYVNTQGEPVELAQATVTYDYSKAAGVLSVTGTADPDDEDSWESCTTGTGKLTCRLPAGWELDGEDDDALPEVAIKAAANAKVGATGDINVTLTDKSVGTANVTSRVRVGENVDLAAGAATTVSAALNSGFDRTISVKNNGRKAVNGVIAVFDASNNLVDDETDYSNCNYDEDGYLLFCRFDTVLAVGKSYSAKVPMWVAEGATAPGQQASEVTWMTTAEAEDAIDEDDQGEPGESDALALAQARAPLAREGEQADGNGDNNSSTVTVNVTGKNGSDVAVTGSTTTAKVGAEVELKIGYVNNGPADLETLNEELALTAVDVVLPQGVTLISEPVGCEEGEADNTWRCYADSTLLANGEGEECSFHVKVNRIVANGAGRVTLVTNDEFVTHKSDLNAQNNTAQLIVKG